MKRSRFANTKTRKSAAVITFSQSSQKMDFVFHSIHDIGKPITKSKTYLDNWLSLLQAKLSKRNPIFLTFFHTFCQLYSCQFSTLINVLILQSNFNSKISHQCFKLTEKSTLIFTIFLRLTKSGLSIFNRKLNRKFMFIHIMKTLAGISVRRLFGIQMVSLPIC